MADTYLTISDSNFVTTGTRLGTTISIGRSDNIVTPSGTNVIVKKGISPRLYFSFVKSKLSRNEIKKLKIRTQHLKSLMDSAKEINQTVLYEDSLRLLALTLREQEAAVVGYDRFVKKSDIDKFRNRVCLKIGFCKVENYTRPIPAKVRDILTSVRKRELFDEYWVLFTDPNQKGAAKTDAEKKADRERAKDPILFGKYMYDEENYYYLASWEDEYCDLTLDKFIDEMNKEKSAKEYAVEKIAFIDADTAESVKAEAARKWNLFHQGMLRTEPPKEHKKPKSWWKFW